MRENHGLSKLPEYAIWGAMKRRCYNQNCKPYPAYGGRGITVCEAWRDSFKVFIDDVGQRPFVGAELERIDNDGNYEPGNVKWATRKEQTNNTRASRKLTFRGETLTIQQWAERLGMPHDRLRARIDRLKMPIEVALDPNRKSVKGLKVRASSWKPHQDRVWGLQ